MHNQESPHWFSAYNLPVSRRSFLRGGAAGASGLVFGGATWACGERSQPPRPETEAQRAIYNTYQIYKEIHKDQHDSFTAEILALAALFSDKSPSQVIDSYKNVGHDVHDDSKIKALLTLGVESHGAQVPEVVAAYKKSKKKLGDNDQEKVRAANLTNISLVKDTGIDQVLDYYKVLNKHKGIDDDQAVILTLATVVDQNPAETINDFDLINKHDGVDEKDATMLTLGTVLRDEDFRKITSVFDQVRKHKGVNHKNATSLVLASVVNGYDLNQVFEMYDFARSLGIDKEQSARFTLATAAKTSKLPVLGLNSKIISTVDSSASAMIVIYYLLIVQPILFQPPSSGQGY